MGHFGPSAAGAATGLRVAPPRATRGRASFKSIARGSTLPTLVGMDPITHTMVGAMLGETGVRRYTPLASVTLMLAANAPDIDILAQVGGPYVGLAWRRGLTHGIPALVLLPFVVLGVVLALHKLIRWREPSTPPIRAWPTLLLAFIGVLTHPVLDWMNTYGMRWLMPMDGRWFYGDALFIIDPWLWLGLGGTLFLLHSRRLSGIMVWAALGGSMSFLVLALPLVPLGGKIAWVVGLLSFVVARVFFADALGGEWLARRIVAVASIYIVLMVGADLSARSQVRAALAAEGNHGVSDVMVGPAPANPFAGSIIASTGHAYRLGTFHWLRSPRVILDGTLPKGSWSPPIEAAVRTRDARNFLTWSRFPFYRVEELPDGFRVTIGDARYTGERAAGGLAGVTIELTPELSPRSVDDGP